MAKVNRETASLPDGKEIHEQLQRLTEQRSVRATHEVFEKSFKDYYQEAGYVEVAPLPLISDVDESVLFTGASISAVKDLLLSGEYPDNTEGVYIAQECLRTNALKYAFDNSWIPYGQIYFKMVTILSRPGRFDEVLEEALDYTEHQLGVERSRIKIRSSSQHRDLADVHQLTDIPVEYDTKDADYYHWDYGIEGVHGEGLTVCILNPATGKWFDIGNIVKIYDADGRELGIEFGYGYEFSLTAIVGIDQALKFSRVFELFEFVPGLAQKYYSTIEAVVMMRDAGAQLGDRGVDHVYKQYLKSLQYMGESMDKDADEIVREMAMFADFIEARVEDLTTERDFMSEHRRRKEEFANVIKRTGAFLWSTSKGRQPKEFIQDPIAMINDYLVSHGIRVNEVSHLLQKLQRFDIALSAD